MAERQSHWPIVQRQDSGFWYQLSRFESWWASHCSFRQTPFGEFLFLKRGRSCRLNLTFVARIRLNPAPLHECPGSSAAARMQPRAKRRCTNDLPNSPLLRKPRNTCSARICAPEIKPRRTDSRRGCFARALCRGSLQESPIQEASSGKTIRKWRSRQASVKNPICSGPFGCLLGALFSVRIFRPAQTSTGKQLRRDLGAVEVTEASLDRHF